MLDANKIGSRGTRRALAAIFVSASVIAPLMVTSGGEPAAAATNPIQHIVIIFQENHSFDNVLGRYCLQVKSGAIVRAGLNMPCDGPAVVSGTPSGKVHTGAYVPLSNATDFVPLAAHSVGGQQTAINGGAMDSFDLTTGCRQSDGYTCYTAFNPGGTSIPNLVDYANHFAVSDRTFELATTPSWAGHLVLASATLDGFYGTIPNPSKYPGHPALGPGWGCDSNRDTPWGPNNLLVPSCVPDSQGNGPYRLSPVQYVPTIFDRLEAAHKSWNIFAGRTSKDGGNGWQYAICPTFYECLGSNQRTHMVNAPKVLTAAQDGTLPNFSIVTPCCKYSQHNGDSMAVGDNWIGQVVSAIQSGPDWASTAIFITYDDCGCFYDHVPPPNSEWGIRVPMVIVSPYARAGYTDSTDATYASMLAFAEGTLGLTPLNNTDATAYNYSNAFDYTQPPLLAPLRPTVTHISRRERLKVRRFAAYVENDPT